MCQLICAYIRHILAFFANIFLCFYTIFINIFCSFPCFIPNFFPFCSQLIYLLLL